MCSRERARETERKGESTPAGELPVASSPSFPHLVRILSTHACMLGVCFKSLKPRLALQSAKWDVAPLTTRLWGQPMEIVFTYSKIRRSYVCAVR